MRGIWTTFQFNDEVETFVEELREGVRGIDGQRSEHGENFAPEVVVEVRAYRRVDIGVVVEAHTVLRELRFDLPAPAIVLRGDEFAHAVKDGGQLLPGGQTVRPGGLRSGLDDLLEPGHPHLEKFVEVGGDNAKELEALEQGDGLVLRLVKDAAVEFEPAELAVDKKFGISQVHGQPASFRPHPGKDKRKARGPLPLVRSVV
jgi:hypothetical protein